MVGYFTRRRPSGPRWARPHLESLETRDCPAAPTISLGVTPMSGQMVMLSGTVTDENPAGVVVTFSGVASGSVSPNANGYYSYMTQASALGTVSAVGLDDESLSSNTAQAQVTSNVPSLTLNISYGSGNTVTLYGMVTDENPNGLTVNFSGVVNGSVTTGPSGYFVFTTTASGLGAIQATVADVWGQQSQAAQVMAASNAPVIVDFKAIEGTANCWTFTGRVIDEAAQGLIVHFGGLPSLQGKTAVVQADGTFTLTIVLGPTEEGTATAQTTDWWGLDSNVALAIVDQ